MKTEDFKAIVMDIREDYYLGHIQEEEALETLEEVMRDFGMLDCDEELVALPENFRCNSGRIGAFRVKHERSPYVWSRSYGFDFVEPNVLNSQGGPMFGSNVIANAIVRVPGEKIDLSPVTRLSVKDAEFFASYERQMVAHIGFEKKPFTTDIK